MDIEIKLIEDKINQAFDTLMLGYKEENDKLLKTVVELQSQNQKLKKIIGNLIKGSYPSKKEYHFHKVSD